MMILMEKNLYQIQFSLIRFIFYLSFGMMFGFIFSIDTIHIDVAFYGIVSCGILITLMVFMGVYYQEKEITEIIKIKRRLAELIR